MADTIITQRNAILGYLRKYPDKGITTYEAFTNLGITKLTTRISELRQSGYKFIVHKERNENAVYNRYFIEEEKDFAEFLESPGGGTVPAK